MISLCIYVYTRYAWTLSVCLSALCLSNSLAHLVLAYRLTNRVFLCTYIYMHDYIYTYTYPLVTEARHKHRIMLDVLLAMLRFDGRLAGRLMLAESGRENAPGWGRRTDGWIVYVHMYAYLSTNLYLPTPTYVYLHLPMSTTYLSAWRPSARACRPWWTRAARRGTSNTLASTWLGWVTQTERHIHGYMYITILIPVCVYGHICAVVSVVVCAPGAHGARVPCNCYGRQGKYIYICIRYIYM